jgi:hypothetical protein
MKKKNHVYLRVNNTTPRQALKEKEELHATAINSSFASEKSLSPAKQMHKSTASPLAAVRSTNNDCVASQPNTIKQTAAQAHTVYCVRAGCPTVVVCGVETNWRTVSCLINDHALVCKGGPYGLANPPPQSDIHSAQNVLRPPRPALARGIHGGNSSKAIANRRKQHKKEFQRKQELEDDEYAVDVKPKSVKCRGCQRSLKLDKRSRYYPGLWLKHRKKCRDILKMEVS